VPEYTFNSTTTNLNYFHNDVESEKAIFLIPGGWSDWRAWLKFTEDFNQYSLYAIDPPGRGKSGDLDNFDLEFFVRPMVEFIESINHPNSYVIGHSYGALMACEIGMKIGEKLSGLLVEDPGWVITYEGTDIKDWGPVPIALKHKQNWKTSVDAVYSMNGPDKESWTIDSIMFALSLYEASLNSMKLLNVEDNQDYERICRGLKVKTYVARANTEKGGMIPDQVMDKVENLNPLIQFHEFDTGHGIRSEMRKEYYDLVNEMLDRDADITRS
jgi:pimeloyl-ACP methyl ester carboxylesterase